MAEERDPKKLLWMHRHAQPEVKAREVDFDPVDAIYHLQKNTRNPYLKRAVAPAARKVERNEKELTSLVRVISGQEGYQLRAANQDAPHMRRTLAHPPPARQPHPRFQDVARMEGDRYKLPWMIAEFFRSVLGRLQENPGSFATVVAELLDQFHDNRIRIKLYEAYYNFQNWDQFMETLEEISRYPAPETFDLFCSALFTYYELVYPPEG